MNKLAIVNKLSRSFHKVGFKFKKHSPEIMVGVGVIGFIGASVMACKATTKLSEVLEETKTDIDELHDYVEKHGYSEKYTEEDAKKDLVIMHVQGGVKVAKLYAPAIAVGALSITSILVGHNILRKRNIALGAAYATLDHSFKEYRKRVVERFGEALDKELKFDIKSKEIEEVVTNEDGTETIVKKTVTTANALDPNKYSEYARIFDDGCIGWDKDAEYNFVFAKQMQNQANDMLRSRGHLFLNEVYEMFGFPKTKAGQVVGWVYDENNPRGDNFVDFGIFDIDNARARDFVNGYERCIILDFNVDGNIWDLLQ